MKIVLTQTGSMGDCLLTTTIARQIKEIDYPGCHLTWVIGERFKEVIENNPHVDEVIVLPMHPSVSLRYGVRAYVDELKSEGKVFDKTMVLDLDAKNAPHVWGTCRSIYFRIYQEVYGHRVTVSPEPVICLREDEVGRVKTFCRNHEIDGLNSYPILIEYSPASGQSMMDQETALDLAVKIVEKYPHVKCILSSKDRIKTPSAQIIDGSILSYRENAELLNHCKLLVGANSGITWLNASTWSKKIPMIQDVMADFTDNNTEISFSVEMDCKCVGASTKNLIELHSPTVDELYKCVCEVIDSSFDEVKSKYKGIDTPVTEYMYRFYESKHKLNLMGTERKKPLSQTSVFPAYAKLKFYIFNLIPIMTMRQKRGQINIKLFGIPFLKIKGK
ncbi:MAG: hypothetical protein WCG03_02050 [Kiritimatiellales bacterium]